MLPVNKVPGRNASDSDSVLTNDLSTRRDSRKNFPTLVIVGALCNPLLQNWNRMVPVTVCFHIQLADGMEYLHTYVKEYYENVEVETVTMALDSTDARTSKYSTMFLLNPIKHLVSLQQPRQPNKMVHFLLIIISNFYPKWKVSKRWTWLTTVVSRKNTSMNWTGYWKWRRRICLRWSQAESGRFCLAMWLFWYLSVLRSNQV